MVISRRIEVSKRAAVAVLGTLLSIASTSSARAQGTEDLELRFRLAGAAVVAEHHIPPRVFRKYLGWEPDPGARPRPSRALIAALSGPIGVRAEGRSLEPRIQRLEADRLTVVWPFPPSTTRLELSWTWTSSAGVSAQLQDREGLTRALRFTPAASTISWEIPTVIPGWSWLLWITGASILLLTLVGRLGRPRERRSPSDSG